MKRSNFGENPNSPADSTISHAILAEKLWQDEIKCPPKDIQVHISDPTVPIVVLFGPPASGKTMTLIRLTRYLQQQGYLVRPDRLFRDDVTYRNLCDNFPEMVNSVDAVHVAYRFDCMLVDVLDKKGNRICKILHVPGEDCLPWDPKVDNGTFPKYMYTIMNSRNRKIWVFMVEDSRLSDDDRKRYVAKIAELQIRMNRQDKAIVLFNKIDETPFVQSYRQVDTKAAFDHIKHQYPGIFDLFRNANPIVRIFSEYRCKFLPFSTGSFYTTAHGRMTFEMGDPIYPCWLWNTILKLGKRYSIKHLFHVYLAWK